MYELSPTNVKTSWVEKWRCSCLCWLSILTILLQHHLAISCKVRKYGTLLYRPNVDFNTLLAQNLWEKRNHSQNITCTSCAHLNSVNSSQKDFLLDLNKLVHSQIQLCFCIFLSILAFINKERFELSYQREDFYHPRAHCGSMELLHQSRKHPVCYRWNKVAD